MRVLGGVEDMCYESDKPMFWAEGGENKTTKKMANAAIND